MDKTILITGQPTTNYPNGVEVSAKLALKSKTLSDTIEDFGGVDVVTNLPINIENQTNDDVALVFQYMAFLEDYLEKNPVPEGGEKETSEERGKLKPWEDQFFNKISMKSLFNFILISNYLAIKPTLDAGSKRVANMIKGKTADEIRKTFAITE